jgi:hypothetical protein
MIPKKRFPGGAGGCIQELEMQARLSGTAGPGGIPFFMNPGPKKPLMNIFGFLPVHLDR